MNDTLTLDGQLVVARDIVQDFLGGLGGLVDGDLTTVVRSPSWQPRVSSSPNPTAPFLADTGLRHHVMAGAVDCHHAAVALCAIEFVDDPLPWEEPPVPDRRSIPPLHIIRRHLAHLDASLAEVQSTHMPAQDDRVAALIACELIINSDALTYQPKSAEDQPEPPRRTRGIWLSLAATREPTCHLCGGLDHQRINTAGPGQEPAWTRVPRPVRGRVCARCRAAALSHSDDCRNPLQRKTCRGVIAFPKLGLCSTCYQAQRDAARGRSPQMHARLTATTTRTTRCVDCGQGVTVADGTTPRCDTCRDHAAA